MAPYPTYPQHKLGEAHGIPWRGVLTVAALALILALVFVLRDTFDPIARARVETQAQARAVHDALISTAVQPVDVLTAALWRLIPPALVIAGAGVGLAIAWRRYGWRESVKAHYVVKLAQAERPPLPTSLHTLTLQAPRTERQPYAPALPQPARDEARPFDLPEDAPGLDESTPTFRALLDSGQIGRDGQGRLQPLILGYHQGAAITGDWRSLYSSGLGGLQGSGKTSTAAALLAQSAAAGAQIVICDPHAGDEESLAVRVQPLAPAFLCDIAEDERSILHAVKLADAELQRRKHGHPDRTPLIVAIDEWGSLRRGQLADLLPAFVEDFSTEGRKLNCHVMLLGQRWDKSSVGDFRNTLASSYVHRMRPDEARMMTGLRASSLPADTLQLPPGVAYLLDTRGSLTRVHIPHITPADVRAVGAMISTNGGHGLDQEHKPAPVIGFGLRRPSGKTPEPQAPINRPEGENKPLSETGETAPERAETDPETAHILALFYDDGMSIGEIVKRLWPEAKSGTPYNERRAYVEEVIRTRGRKI